MSWDLTEEISFYKSQGAPSDQNELINLLKEVQNECGGCVPKSAVKEIIEAYNIKESCLNAIVKRIPSLKFSGVHTLEICSGDKCLEHKKLHDFIENEVKKAGDNIEIKYVGCMHMCAKGPNIKWDNTLYNCANEKLIKSLIDKIDSI